MQLVEEGKVRLDDLAETYVPEVRLLPRYNKQMRFTLQQLASHTAGLDREPRGVPDVNIGPVDKWEEKVLALIPHASFHSSPGEQYSYSNVGFALLGLALERAGGDYQYRDAPATGGRYGLQSAKWRYLVDACRPGQV